MQLLKAGMKVELRNQWNDYEVLKADERQARLKCVSFIRAEDLGDGILCQEEGQEIWIAQYHAVAFELSYL